MNKDRVEIDLPHYDGLLAGYYVRGPGYARRRVGGTDDWLLVATLAGEGRFGTADGDLQATEGTLTLISPGTTHDYGTAKSAELWEILWVHFQPPISWDELLHWPDFSAGVAQIAPTNALEIDLEIEACFRDVERLSVSSLFRRRQFAMNALERLLLIVDRDLPKKPQPLDDRIRTVIDHIQGHLRESLTLDQLSGLVHLSPSRFAHLFRQQIGLSPIQYVALQKNHRAKTLLERTTLTVAEIGAELGMEPFHFSARFKALTGVSPRVYRASRSA